MQYDHFKGTEEKCSWKFQPDYYTIELQLYTWGENMFEDIDKKKALLDKKIPLNKDVIYNLKKYFDVELTYNSNAIEGNTLTITETKIILEEGITIGKGKTLKEHLEVINHKEAIDLLLYIHLLMATEDVQGFLQI